MNQEQKSVYEARVRIIKALAHSARLMMVCELEKESLCVCDIRDRVGSDLSTVSKHLSILKNAGIVAIEKRGVQVFYSLRCPCVISFLTCAEKVLAINAREHARLAGKRRRG